jgi:phosphatidate cytidylyltransferase
MGHLYVCTLVAVIELLLFRELVRVRYNAHFDTVQNRIPFFRTTQWCWFVLSILYTYGDFVYDVIQSNPRMHHLNRYLQYLSTISFILYSGVLVLTISTLQPGYIKFQMNQLCWTTLVICLTVGQLKYVFHNVFNGLIWFCLPCCLVFTNDIAAYGAGMTWGRKFIQRPFLALSPNKTWEGFIGGWAVTMITSWYLAKALAQYSWMICPTNRFTTEIHAPLSCVPDPIFLEAQSYFPSQIFELLPDFVVKQIPGIVDVCLVKSPDSSLPAFLASAASAAVSGASASAGLDAHSSLLSSASSSAAFASSLPSSAATGGVSASAAGEFLTPCVSGDPNQVHHHFELTMRNHYPIQVHALWLGLFASLVAPFGGE